MVDSTDAQTFDEPNNDSIRPSSSQASHENDAVHSSPANTLKTFLRKYSYDGNLSSMNRDINNPRTRKRVNDLAVKGLKQPQIKKQRLSKSDQPSSSDGGQASESYVSHGRKKAGGLTKKLNMRSIQKTGKVAPLNIENKLKDSLRPGLKLIMVGVNPGITTALTGHAYSHKSNRYWPTMFDSGVTPIRHLPCDTHSLMDLYGIGHTNIVERTTRTEADIQPHEWPIGAAVLDEKIKNLKPEGVAIVGKGIWKRWFEYKHGRKFKDSGKDKDCFEYGWQDEDMRLGRTVDQEGNIIWPGSETIVVATTSGAAAQFAANGGEQRIALWKPLGEWFRPKREEWIRSKSQARDK